MVRPTSNVGIKVEVWESLAAELLMTIAAHQHPLNWDSLEAGKARLDAIEKGMSADLRTALSELGFTGPAGGVWGAAMGWTWRRRISDPAVVAEAIESADAEAVAAWTVCLPEAHPFRAADPRPGMARVLRLWRRDLFATREAELAAILHRDAEAKRALARRLPPERLLEVATNGVTWRPQPGVHLVVLTPCQVMSPWVDHERVGDAIVFAYPVVDAGGDEGQRISRLAWVLADRSRVAALRLLAEKTMTLQELADELGLGKSTMHHHLALLRAAGLLRVPFGTKTYGLRREPLEQLAGALSVFGRDG